MNAAGRKGEARNVEFGLVGGVHDAPIRICDSDG